MNRKVISLILSLFVLNSCVVFYKTQDIRSTINTNVSQVNQNYSKVKGDYEDRSEIFENTIHKYENDYKNLKVGSHTARIMEISRNIAEIGFNVLDSIIPIIVVCIFTNIFFFYNNKTLGLISVSGLFLLFLVCYYFIPKLIELSSKREHIYLQMNEKIQDSYNNLMNIYLNNDQENIVKSNTDLQKSYTDFFFKQIMYKLTMLLAVSGADAKKQHL